MQWTFVTWLPWKQGDLLNANIGKPLIIRPLLFEQCTIVLKLESQGKGIRYKVEKDEEVPSVPFHPILQSSQALPAILLPLTCSLCRKRARAEAAVGKAFWNCLGSFVPLPQGLSEWDRFICARKTVCCGNQLPLFSWLHQALNLLESEVWVKMQKRTFYYDLQFFRGEAS